LRSAASDQHDALARSAACSNLNASLKRDVSGCTHLEDHGAGRNGERTGERQRADTVAVDAHLRAIYALDHLEMSDVLAYPRERTVERAATLCNPRIAPALERFEEVIVRINPPAHRLLGQRDLRQRSRGRGELVGPLEARQGLRIASLLPEC